MKKLTRYDQIPGSDKISKGILGKYVLHEEAYDVIKGLRQELERIVDDLEHIPNDIKVEGDGPYYILPHLSEERYTKLMDHLIEVKESQELDKFNWTDDNIQVGMFVCKIPKKGEFEICGWNLKWTYQIGYDNQYHDSLRYVLINTSDGRTMSSGLSIGQLIDFLISNSMMPMPPNWLTKILEYRFS